MLKILLVSALVTLLSVSDDTKVYICDSENAVAYHYTKECRGIKRCTHEILKVTKKEAVEKELKLCGWEY
ncbi:MAG: hypothetical protein P8P74_11885 [Crocinitomicaceae bacterium]|nr:hypothetical protein [Crocinitomicaceae bacterium]